MPRKSPRSRRKPGPDARLPSPGRPRSKPGQGRAAERSSARDAASAGRSSARLPDHRGAPRVPGGARAISRRPARPIEGRARTVEVPRTRVASVRFKPPAPDRVANVLAILERLYPEATTALDHENAFQLLIATILSAQCTDERVNLVTPALFARYPGPAQMAEASREDLETMIRSTGFFRNKARAIRECSADIAAKHGGRVPATLEELTALRGVGRKTANVVLGNAYGIPGLVVDTHVARLSKRLGFTREIDPVKIEFALMEIVPREKWTLFSHWLILHGRRVCIARKPRCSICPLLPHCPRVGVTASQ